MVDVFIESWEMVRARPFSTSELKSERAIQQQMLGNWFIEPEKTSLIADIDSKPMGFIVYGQSRIGFADPCTVIKQFNTIPTLGYKIGSVLFKSLCNDPARAGRIIVSSTYQGEGAYRAFGFEGDRRALWLSEERRRQWQECSEGVFPERFTTVNRQQSLDRLLRR